MGGVVYLARESWVGGVVGRGKMLVTGGSKEDLVDPTPAAAAVAAATGGSNARGDPNGGC